MKGETEGLFTTRISRHGQEKGRPRGRPLRMGDVADDQAVFTSPRKDWISRLSSFDRVSNSSEAVRTSLAA